MKHFYGEKKIGKSTLGQITPLQLFCIALLYIDTRVQKMSQTRGISLRRYKGPKMSQKRGISLPRFNFFFEFSRQKKKQLKI